MTEKAGALETSRLIIAAIVDPALQPLVDNLRQRGFRVTALADGRQALEQVQSSRPALVLAEILLPGLDGLQICQAIKSGSATRETPVLLVSVLAAADRAAEAGADLFLRKPLQAAVVLQAIEELARGLAAPRTSASGL